MIPDKTSRWWKEPMVWMIMGLPLSAVIAAVASAVIAFKHQDPLVSEEVHKLGLTTTQGKDREDQAASLGLSASLHLDADRIKLKLSGRMPAWPAELLLRLVHPTQAGKDRNVRMLRVDGMGRYEAAFAGWTDMGRRLLILEPEDASWRLIGSLPSTAMGEAHLAAGSQKPPTHL